MSESRNIRLAVLLSLLLHVVLLGLAAGGSTGRTLAVALSDNQGAVAQLNNGDAGAISVHLIGNGEAPVVSPDASFDLETDAGRLASIAVTDVAAPLAELKSPYDPSDSDDGKDAGDRATQGAVADDGRDAGDRATQGAVADDGRDAGGRALSGIGAGKAVRHSIPLDDYSAQIMGRIERAWVRPLAQLEGAFHCEVQISQTPQGEVRDIVLTQCNGDPVWRESITRAIRYAAPLPAAPSENAFRPVLTFNFQAQPLSQALLAELLSVSEELSSVEPRDNTLEPARGRASPDASPAADPRWLRLRTSRH